ncbi:unnamed protein product [Echinostoma caproni]|uniref:carbonic anhydrase n=1 Tax=Echinostoma caproni TaxID=27848 RepID=A0A183AMH8_9TREM|nr:unnamed protein product [Echinostoma caproni]
MYHNTQVYFRSQTDRDTILAQKVTDVIDGKVKIAMDTVSPHTWAIRFPAAAGKKQSPVNLNTGAMQYDASLKPLQIDFKGVENQTVDMKAHNFQVKIGGKAVLRGGPLEHDYHLTQFHFHWGSGNTWGSEHHVNGVSSPAELHLVFANSKYSQNEVLTEQPDGLSVVGVFLQLGTQTNPALEQLCKVLPTMNKGDSKVIEPRLPLQSLIPMDSRIMEPNHSKNVLRTY